MKSGEMLVVMIPRTDSDLRSHNQRHPQQQQGDTVDEQVDHDIEQKQANDARRGNSIFLVAKKLGHGTIF